MVGFFDKKHFYEFIFPIDNLELIGRSFSIGKVKFFEYNIYKYNKIMKKIRVKINKNQYYVNRPQAKKNVLNHISNYYKLNLTDNDKKICAITEDYGHIDDAYLHALHDVKIAINVLKLYRYQNDDFYKTYFGIQGEIIPRKARAVLVKASPDMFRPSVEAYGSSYPYKIDNQRISFMKQNGFNILKNLLKKNRFNALDRRIISSINWFGESFNSHIAVRQKYKSIHQAKRIGTGKPKNYGLSEPERLVFCITAIEALYSFSNNDSYEKIAKRISKVIMGNATAEYTKLYKIRCSIVHGGQSYVDKKDLDDMFLLTRSAITALIRRKGRLGINNVPDLRKWLVI